MKKQDIIDALGAYGVPYEEMESQTRFELGQRLSKLNQEMIERDKRFPFMFLEKPKKNFFSKIVDNIKEKKQIKKTRKKIGSEVTKGSKRLIRPEGLNVVYVTRSYTCKAGEYNKESYFCSRTAEVEKGDDIIAVSNWIAYECKVDVEAQMNNI